MSVVMGVERRVYGHQIGLGKEPHEATAYTSSNKTNGRNRGE